RHGNAARGLGEDAFRPRQEQHGLGDLRVAHVFRPTARATDYLDREVAVRRVADSQRLGNGIRLADRSMCVRTALHGATDGITSGRLCAVNLARRIGDQADALQFLKGLLYLADQTAASHGDDDVLRHTPAKLLGYFKAD